MTGHEYLVQILEAQKMLPLDLAPMQTHRAEIETNLRSIYGTAPRFYYGGSYGKDTLVKASYDLDIVMYFPNSDYRSVGDLYNSVHQSLNRSGYTVVPKNVALRLPYQGNYHIDVVPGKARDDSFVYATLYKREENSTRQTSIKVHIDSVRKSNARNIIKLMKLWKLRHNLDWMSFAIEQTVIRALDGQSVSDYGNAMWKVFQFIRDNISNLRLVDPANSANIIEMSPLLRQQLRSEAMASLSSSDWKYIIW